MTLKKAERLIPAPASQPAMRFIGLDLEDLDTYPPESLDHPPAVKRSTAVFDSGTEGCLRQPQATSGNPRSSASRINSLPPKAAGGFMPRST